MPKEKIGCPILDKAGIGVGQRYKGVDLCLNCPYPGCIVGNYRETDLIIKKESKETKEIYLRCRKCGATETLTFTDGKLQETQKWQQRGGVIYHMLNCGIAEVMNES